MCHIEIIVHLMMDKSGYVYQLWKWSASTGFVLSMPVPFELMRAKISNLLGNQIFKFDDFRDRLCETVLSFVLNVEN